MSYYCGVDIGGTFTDCVVLDEEGNVFNTKASSTPPNFSQGFLDVLQLAADRLEMPLEDFLAQTAAAAARHDRRHQRARADARRQDRPDHDARARRRAADHALLRPLRRPADRAPAARVAPPQAGPDGARRRASRRSRSGSTGPATCSSRSTRTRRARRSRSSSRRASRRSRSAFLWGFVNPAHELRVKEIVEELAPGRVRQLRARADREAGRVRAHRRDRDQRLHRPEHGQATCRQVDRATTDRGYDQPLLIMQAAGGVVPASAAAGKPLFTIGSGPGRRGHGRARTWPSCMGHENVIACDMGGTSFDVGIIVDGEPLAASETVINQYTLLHAAARHRVDRLGRRLDRLGGRAQRHAARRAARAPAPCPGPPATAAAATRPTVTDCDLVLGRYNPDTFLGGELELDRAALAAGDRERRRRARHGPGRGGRRRAAHRRVRRWPT